MIQKPKISYNTIRKNTTLDKYQKKNCHDDCPYTTDGIEDCVVDGCCPKLSEEEEKKNIIEMQKEKNCPNGKLPARAKSG